MFEQIISFENLLLAYKRASKAKHDRIYIQEYEYNLEYNLFDLQKRLRNETFEWGNYHSFFVYEPKKRHISAAPFEDRIVHHAIHNYIEPLFERNFIDHSCACRKGKGTHKGLLYTFSLVKKNKYYLKCDISKYFDSINGAILYKLLKKEISDEKLLRLLKRLIASGSISNREGQQRLGFLRSELNDNNHGVPIGNLTSQLFANIYLNELDKYVINKLGFNSYLRYMDDFVLFANTKNELWQALKKIDRFISTKLKLKLHPHKVNVAPVLCGIDFLGYKTYPKKIFLRQRNLHRFYRRQKNQALDLVGGRNLDSIKHSIASFLGIINYLYPKPVRDYWFTEVFSHPFNILESSTKLPDKISYPFVDRKESL